MASDPNERPRERTHRRRYDAAFKRALVEQTLAPGASVARIAREHGINANQVFKWRRQQWLAGQSDRSAPQDKRVSLIPVTLVAEQSAPGLTPAPATGAGQIEITLAGSEVRIRGTVDAATLQAVLSSLRR